MASSLRKISAAAAAAAALLLCPPVWQLLMDRGILPRPGTEAMFDSEYVFWLPLLGCLAAALLSYLLWTRDALPWGSAVFNLSAGLWLSAVTLMLTPIAAGMLKLPRLLLIGLIIYLMLRAFVLGVVRRREKLKAYKRNLWLTAFALFSLFWVLEGTFLFAKRPHGFNGTLASRAWFRTYWQTNSLGYRDREYEGIENKKKILVIGDSFTAGHGIEDPADRFTDKLEAELGAQTYRVCNLGVMGSDTRDELRRLKEFPYKPDLLILQWTPNDVEDRCKEAGRSYTGYPPYAGLDPVSTFFVQHSYFLNFLYWKIPHGQAGGDYRVFVQDCLYEPESWAAYEQDLAEIVQLQKRDSIPVLAVAFPFLKDPKGSTRITDRVSNYLKENGIATLNLTEKIYDRHPDMLVVNSSDSHPNAEVHGMVAGWLRDAIQAHRLLPTDP